MKHQMKVLLPILLVIVLSVSSIWAGTTGKIAGVVTDKATGEPLPGANVIIAGTVLGAAADLDGQYSILKVPPGTYEIQISVIGYKKVTVNDVVVNIDQTARIDVAMESQSFELDELVVVDKRNPTRPDVATSVVSVTGKEIENLPIASVQDVLGMQAGIGVDSDGDNIMIRGSNDEQSLFMIDGITMRDPRNNSAVTKVALSTVKEISIERGGFNAEYGQVQAGLVNIVTNEGGSRGYSGSFQIRMAPPAPKYYRGSGIPDVHDPNSYWLRPYFDPLVAFTGTNTPESAGGWDEFTRKEYLPFVGWNAISEQLNTDNDPNNDLTPLGAQRALLYETRKKQNNDIADYEIDGGFGGPIPFISEQLGNLRFFTSYRRQREALLFPMSRPDYVDYDWRLKVTSDITNMLTLHLNANIGNIATMEDNWNKGNFIHTPTEISNGTGGFALFNLFSDWTYSLTDISHKAFSGKIIHTLSPNTYYEVSLEHFARKYDSRPPEFRDTTSLFEVLPGFFETSNPFGYFPVVNASGGIIIKDGEQQARARDNSTATATTLKADLSTQIDFNNLLKAGVEFIYNDLDLDYGFIRMQTSGKTYDSRVQMRNFPIRAAAYVQDKLETKGFTFNGGLRLDYSNARTDWWDYSAYDPNFYANSADIPRTKKSEPQWQISPRLGISHPISENAKLFFNYGHFKQMPQYEAMFRYDRAPNNTLVRIGDPNMILERTISYELGLDYNLPENILLQVNAFYRDITDQADQTTYQSIGGNPYDVTENTYYSDIRGVELTLRKSSGNWFYGFINATYQVTSYGNFGTTTKYQDPLAQENWENNLSNIYQTRPIPTPNAKANLTFSTPDDWGPKFLNHNILGAWMLNVYLNWSQGGWDTYNPKNVSGVTNNVQYVDYFNGQLRLAKTFVMKDFSVQLFMDVTNLFDGLRLTYVQTGNQDYRTSLHLKEDKGYDNIPGDDKFGDYRKPGIEWQPMVYQNVVDVSRPAGTSRAIYYEGTSGIYWQYVNNQWTQVSQEKINQINEDKAYIFMPGASTFWFLNPRAFFFGARVQFNLDF